MQIPFSLGGRTFAPLSPTVQLDRIAKVLYAPQIPLIDETATRIVLSNHLPVRTPIRIRVFDSDGQRIPVRWSGPEPQTELTLLLEPFVTRFVEIEGADYAASVLAWATIETASPGTTGYLVTTHRKSPQRPTYLDLVSDDQLCIRLPFDCEQGRVSHFTVINTGGERGDEGRDFLLRFFSANNPQIETTTVHLRCGHSRSVVPDLEKLRNHSGVVEVRALDEQPGFFVSGQWFHPEHQSGILPTLPANGGVR